MRPRVNDAIAIVGVASTGFNRHGDGRSQQALALEACVSAIADSGLDKGQIDGISGTSPAASNVAAALGMRNVHHFATSPSPIVFTIVDAMNALFAGSCDAVVAYHAVYRTPANSASAQRDPLRRGLGYDGQPTATGRVDPETGEGPIAYASWAQRYMWETGTERSDLGRIAVNARTNGARNPLAAFQEPLTMEQYLAGRMVRSPLCLYDMDVPADGADAFVLTTAERAKDLPHRPVLIHAATTGLMAPVNELQTPDLDHTGQRVVAERLRAKSDLWLDDADVYFPYDGFSFLTLAWLEHIGWCGRAEAKDFVKHHWDDVTGRLMINGRVPVNPHGGALAEGATQGSGHVREAVTQLRGAAGDRQAPRADVAMLNIGGLFYNAQGLILRGA